MKNLSILFTLGICLTLQVSFAQSLNWENLKDEQKHIASVNIGWEYGVVFGAGYSYHLKSRIPALLSASFSIPSGGKLVDDFKTKMGGQFRLYRNNHFQFSSSLYGIYRRYENPLGLLNNFGAELTAVAGFYKSKWFVAGEFAFDKAIATQFKHSDSFKENIYANVKDGWYSPATGGHFLFGLQGGYSFKQHDLTVKIGKAVTQNFKTTPLIPYYVQFGYNIKINGQARK